MESLCNIIEELMWVVRRLFVFYIDFVIVCQRHLIRSHVNRNQLKILAKFYEKFQRIFLTLSCKFSQNIWNYREPKNFFYTQDSNPNTHWIYQFKLSLISRYDEWKKLYSLSGKNNFQLETIIVSIWFCETPRVVVTSLITDISPSEQC